MLQDLKQQAYYAFQGTSFSPEKRAESSIKEHTEMLENDIKFLKESGTYPEKIEEYKNAFILKYKIWLGAKTQCLSTMIAGPANFPVARAEKANKREMKLYNEFMDWRAAWVTNTNKRIKREEIEAAGGELGMARKKLEEEKSQQEMMKRVNKAYKLYKTKGLPGIENLSEEEQRIIIQWVPRYTYETVPFQGYELRNILARIKNAEQRVKTLENKEFKATAGNKEVLIDGGKIVLNYEVDRIQIFNDKRPEPEVIISYKKHGLKWSPFNKCWQRQITPNALFSMKHLFKIEL